MDIRVKDVIEICSGRLIFGDKEIVCKDFSKDTRTIKKDDVYVGIKGENFDGNTLYEKAFEQGAKVCILEDSGSENELQIKYENVKRLYSDRVLVVVEDSIRALQELASYKRDLYDIPVVAITGSVGKTSTKDIIASVVGMQYKVLKTQGNLNNHIGLPLTILGLDDHDALVVEMGMNNLGEISVLSKIAKPNVAVITNVGTSHIGKLGSRENILKAKLEILDGLKKDGILIINNDNDLLNSWSKAYTGNVKIFTYGIENTSDVMASDIMLEEDSSNFKVHINNSTIALDSKYCGGDIKNCENNEEEIIVPIGGQHFVYNALSAVAVGTILGIPYGKIREGIQKFELSKNRMELINLKDDIIVINDCYNANYDSMKASIEYLAKTSANRKIAVLGDMLELGEFSESLHKQVGEQVVKNKIDILVTVGNMGKVISDTAKSLGIEVCHCSNNEEAANFVKDIMSKDDIILIKASNGMKFKQIVEEICKL